MKFVARFLLTTLLPGMVACSEQPPSTGSITLIESPRAEGCTYNGLLYSQGALKRSMKADVNDMGEPVMLENPDGPLLLCVRGGMDGFRWTTNHKFADLAAQDTIQPMTEVIP